jgi:hypothetical protein
VDSVETVGPDRRGAVEECIVEGERAQGARGASALIGATVEQRLAEERNARGRLERNRVGRHVLRGRELPCSNQLFDGATVCGWHEPATRRPRSVISIVWPYSTWRRSGWRPSGAQAQMRPSGARRQDGSPVAHRARLNEEFGLTMRTVADSDDNS